MHGEDWMADAEAFEAAPGLTWKVTDSNESQALLKSLNKNQESEISKIHTLEHQVPIGGGHYLHVTESFTLSSWLRGPRRAIIFLSSSVHKGHCWSIPVPGYSATEMAAERGMFAYTLDYIGVGESHVPKSGIEISVQSNVDAIRNVIKHIRCFRAIPKIDLVGEGYGGIVASQLASDEHRIRSCVMIAIPYKELAGGPATSAEHISRLSKVPNGFLPMQADEYDLFLDEAPPEVKNYIRETQPGPYPVAFTLVVLQEPPFFDPSTARAPGLLLCGAKDQVVGPNDPQELAADYGTSGAKLVISETAGHAPRVEGQKVAKWLWEQIFQFTEDLP